MALPVTLYTYEPTPNVIKAFSTLDSPIVIMSNDVAISTTIHEEFKDRRFEDFVFYLDVFPLYYALIDLVDPFLPQHICEFYYTSTYYEPVMIIGTIEDGQHIISMTVTNFLKALRLPIYDEYSDLPTDQESHIVLTKLGYGLTKQRNHDGNVYTLPQCPPTTLKFLTEFQENVVTTLDSLVQLTTNMSQCLTTIESNVSEIKRLLSDTNIEHFEDDGPQRPPDNDQQPPPGPTSVSPLDINNTNIPPPPPPTGPRP
ncbi:unnamed protein product [Lactuca virosa]|uniref:Uncharacterized protein n=1 Tax=Lactuca virosa TaxID=75947 RepID=A0AAU9P631_9ASTR|nr:unnamed protein product [Lactuca virosa]